MSKRRRDRSRVELNSSGDCKNPEECDAILEDIVNETKHYTPSGHFRVDTVPGATIITDLEPDDPALAPPNSRRRR